MSNITELFSPILPIITKYYPHFISLFIPLISFFLGWKVNNRVADREFLRTEIYVPLHEEIIFMKENISKYEYCFYVRPDKPHNEKIGNIMHTLKKCGQYNLIPSKLRNNIDEYYQKCEEYDKNLRIAKEEIKRINIKEIRKLKTEKNHEQFLKKVAEIKDVPVVTGIGFYGSPKMLLSGEYVGGL